MIRTMKDDLSGSGKPAPSAAPPPTAPPPAFPPVPIPIPIPAPIPASFTGPTNPPPIPAKAAQFPLPPPKTPLPPSATPNIARRNRHRVFGWLSATLLILAVLGGGAWAFITYVSIPGTEPPPAAAPTVAQSVEVLPTSTGLAVHYRLSGTAARGELLRLWQNSPKTLLQGNPKTLLSNPAVTEFMYVGIPGESRPFLVVPAGALPQSELTAFTSAQMAESSGWLILHALNATPYLEALAQGSGLPEEASRRLTDETDVRPLRIYLSELALNQIRDTSAGPDFAVGILKEAVISLGPTPGGQTFVFEGTGLAGAASSSPAVSTTITAPKADQGLLASIPSDATFFRIGGNLNADITAWQSLSQVLDRGILDQSSVNVLIAQLVSPYAYYHRLGPDGSEDIGLVATIPPGLTPPLAPGDASLEKAVQALLPLVIETSPAITPAFADGVYQGVPLRFVNVSGSTKALDYAILDNTLHLATSKEGMFAGLDATAARLPSLETSEPWQTIWKEWGAIPSAETLLGGNLTFISLVELLPTTETTLPFALTLEPAEGGLHLTGAILMSKEVASAALPSASPAASPSPSPLEDPSATIPTGL